MKKEHSKSLYVVICLIFVISLIVIAFSISYAIAKPDVFGNPTETIINTSTFDIETSLDSLNNFSASNMSLLNTSEIEENAPKIEFTVKSKSATDNAGKFNIYIKDISISNGLIDSNFKWDLIMDGNVIKSGNFSDIETKGVISTTIENLENVKHFDSYYLATGISFNNFQQSSLVLRVYLLNDSTLNQNNLMNGNFECKVAVEAYNSK